MFENHIIAYSRESMDVLAGESTEFTNLVTYLAEELKQIEGLEEGLGHLSPGRDKQVEAFQRFYIYLN